MARLEKLLAATITLIAATSAVTTSQATYEPYAIATFAGLAGHAGSDNGAGTAARFNSPASVAVDVAGNIYVADTLSHTIRKITPGAVVSTLAGSPGISGSADGIGSAARFSYPSGTTVDSAGNVYVADHDNHTIRKITPGGVVSTPAGSPGISGSADGVGGMARFYYPTGITVDSANTLYVADAANHTIRKITAGGMVSTLAGAPGISGSADGTGSAARFNYPYGVTVDSAGNGYIADIDNHTIRKVTSGGIVTTLAGLAGVTGSADGTGSAARFHQPFGVAVDSASNVYVADGANYTIRKITSGGVVSTLAGLAGANGSGDGIGSAARFGYPSGVALSSSGNLYVADQGNHIIRLGVPTLAPAGWGDFNGDSFTDFLLFRSSTQRTAIWNLRGNAFLSGVYGPTLPADWVVRCVADVNLDSKPDYVLFNASTRQTAVWFLNNATFLSGAYGPTLPAGWTLITAVDINVDGRPDYVLFNGSTRQTAIWLLNGTAFSSGAYGPTLPAGWMLLDALDFDGDGKPDFLLGNSSTRQTEMWYLDGTTHISSAYGPTLPFGWTLQGAADFNGDAKSDYVLFEANTGRTALWYLNGAALIGSAFGPTLAAGYVLASP